jgi:uncharacterized protein with PIN domain
MILDTSALAAIFFDEPEAGQYTQVIHDADHCLISAGEPLLFKGNDFKKTDIVSAL